MIDYGSYRVPIRFRSSGKWNAINSLIHLEVPVRRRVEKDRKEDLSKCQMEFEKQPLIAESNDAGKFPVHLRLGAQQQAIYELSGFTAVIRAKA
jgi:hypothetical protein